MTKYALFVILIVAAFAGVPRDAAAWDDVGHKLTGYIAWQRMSPATREKVIKILRSAPEDSHLSTFYIQYGPTTPAEKQLAYFILVPYWADIVRDQSFTERNRKYHRSTWHYSDTFWRQTADGGVEYITDKQPGGQGVIKLVEFDKAIRDVAVKDADKAIAMAWFLHIGGDLHQPLHTSGRHTDREPNGDLGGNLFLISPEGTSRDDQLNLHWYWDSIVIRNIPYREGMGEASYIRTIGDSMMQRYPFDSMSGNLMLGKYDEWQKETFSFAPTEVFRSDLKRFVTPGNEYLRNAYRVTEQRIALAGYRMGETLEQIFSK